MKLTIKDKIKNFFNYYFKPTKIPPPLENTDALINVVNLSKKFSPNGKYFLDKLNFKVGFNQFHIFIGANGAGKTTTIKSIIGSYTKYEGDIYLNGISSKNKNSKQIIGYIPEVAKFPINTSTFSYLLSFALLSHVPKNIAIKRINEYANKLGFVHLLKKNPNNFSSGQKKKILLTQALIHDPKVLIMDEPAANLDPKSRFEFFNILKELQLSGKTIFISSHILGELTKYATHCTILHNGKILYNSTSKLIFDKVELFSNNLLRTLQVIKMDYPNLNPIIINSKMFVNNAVNINFILDHYIQNGVITGFNKSSHMNLQEIYDKTIMEYNNESK